ncbi:lycopene cyclase family protein [Gaetbulibacter aestuarii]|uniref:Lycopene cyclase family protein n=1 Tax=Gaetbulibacter aestuarii TaxID=1502358 RepID=A0ABW7MXV0_9FLAO
MVGNNHFDYIIIGNGLAGLQLALAFSKDPFFSKKSIGLIDPSKKDTNDKTWSFWETGTSVWDVLSYQSWNKAVVFACDEKINLDLNPYNYKSIRSLDFYNYSKEVLEEHSNIQFILDEVTSVFEEADLVKIKGKSNNYSADLVFDSRIPEAFLQNKKDIPEVMQHFKGYVIKTNQPVFDKGQLTMMDYRLKDGEQTTFTYVLPYSEQEALVEFTYFTEHLVEEAVYDSFITNYITNYLKIENYTIVETETGKIPMSTFPFEKFNTRKVIKIGTAGGWVKPSSGYSFKHTEKKVQQIISNLKNGKPTALNLFRKRYRFYDKVFLRVLKDDNAKGEWIFKQFYAKNKTVHMFRFLDEESTLMEDMNIILSLISWPFIKAFFKTLFQ